MPVSKTFLILGGYGYAGLNLADLLLQHTDARLILAGRSQEKADQAAARLNERFPGQRVSARRADAADVESLNRAFQGIDFVLVASTTAGYTKEVVAAALAAGVDYLDIQYAPARLPVLRSFAEDIEKAGLCFVTEAGFHPGLPAAMVRYLGQSFDRMDSALGGTVLNQDGGFPYSSGTEELVQEFRDYKADVFVNGAWRNADMTRMADNQVIDFGQPFGRRSCTPMTLAEMYDLPTMFPSLQRLGFYVAGFNWFADWIVTPIMMFALHFWPQRALKPMTRLLCWATKTFAAPPYGVVLKAEARGEKAGQPLTKAVAVSHPDGYKLTAIPVVAYLLQYLDGSARKPGLQMMGHLADPTRLLQDIQRMGVTVDM
jgi:short subunit dehydrogenase-like uncharacterized protein